MWVGIIFRLKWKGNLDGSVFKSNVNVYMISYVVPIMIDNEAIGVVGMDINFNQLKQLADKAKCFDSGYVFLVDSSNKVLSHKDIKQGTDLQKVDGELASFVKAGKDGQK